MSALSVMVVEDHGFQRRMALRLLADLGVVRVAEAADGHSALRLLEVAAQAPDVLMVDLDMPGMDGIEFIGHVAQRQLARAILVVSALDPALLLTVQNMTRAYGLRVLGSVEKPLTHAKLSAALAGYDEVLQVAAADDQAELTLDTLRAAIAAGEIGPWFQPQAEFGSGRVTGVEALARWRRPDGRVVGPQHFIALAQREGLVDALTDHMLAEACRWKKRWDAQGLRLCVSVNVSPTTLADAATADRYQQIAQAEGVDPAEVVIEITESELMADAARSLGVLARLRLKGFGLSIDDFGTGYSSLAQLSQIPFTELKIDQGFVSGAKQQPRKRAVIEASLELGRKLGLDVVAEGVETVEDWQMLADLGCGFAQGNLIGKAVPGDEVPALIARWRKPER